jgi:hypothetical protein
MPRGIIGKMNKQTRESLHRKQPARLTFLASATESKLTPQTRHLASQEFDTGREMADCL